MRVAASGGARARGRNVVQVHSFIDRALAPPYPCVDRRTLPHDMPAHHSLPISPRHAFAQALDLAVRRDAVQSLLVPFLLHAPWALGQSKLPGPNEPGGMTAHNLYLNSVVLLGDFIISLLVAAMLRFRARAVYNSPPGA